MDLAYLGIAVAFFGSCLGLIALFTHLLEDRS